MSEKTTFQRVIESATERGASDIHLGAGAQPAMRVQGKIEHIPDTYKLSPDDTYAVIEHFLEPRELSVFNTQGEIDTTVTHEGVRMRLHAYKDNRGSNVAFRLINEELPTFDSLNLPPILKDVVDRASHGLILIAGPTGAGKTTTRTSLLEHINETKSSHIISLSDTIEYELENKQSIIHQRTVGATGHSQSYSDALSSALREDPDVISVGDLREQEAIREALSAAHTGHLVIAEVHAQTTTGALTRLVGRFSASDREPVRLDLADALVAVVAQRLIPRIGTEDGKLILATEVLIKNDAVANLIREARFTGIRDIIRSGREDGMHTLVDHIQHLAEAGAISAEDAQRFNASLF